MPEDTFRMPQPICMYTLSLTLLGLYMSNEIYCILFQFYSILFYSYFVLFQFYSILSLQVVRMLAIIVCVFMITWMPYRIMVVYNSFAKEKYMDLWFLLFSRTMIYINSAINPVLYNAMSVKFRRAFKKILTCGKFCLQRYWSRNLRTCISDMRIRAV